MKNKIDELFKIKNYLHRCGPSCPSNCIEFYARSAAFAIEVLIDLLILEEIEK